MVDVPLINKAALALLVTFAFGLAAQGVVLAQQGPQLTSIYRSKLPSSPADGAWKDVPLAEVPLTPQMAIKPTLLAATVSSVSVRSVNDGAKVAFLLEWADSSRDVSASRQDLFRDAAAIEFPVGTDIPAICMGVRGQMVNIWHWKADWQEDIVKGYQDVVDTYPNFYKDAYPGVNILTATPPFRFPADFDTPAARPFMIGWQAGNPMSQPQRTSPVEDTNAVGYSTITHKVKQQVDGVGTWDQGVWRVMFVRALQVEDVDAASITPGKEMPLAFAVWNGANQEVGARKQTSTFLNVTVEPAGENAAGLGAEPWVFIVGLALLLAAGYGAFRLVDRMERVSTGTGHEQ